MKFVMFTMKDGRKVGINRDRVVDFYEIKGGTAIASVNVDADAKDEAKYGAVDYIEVREDFDTVHSRLNTIAE